MSGAAAVLCTYEARADRFGKRSERNRFYRGLFGYTQTVRRNQKVYRYEKDGLLDEVPHIKVADSVFIVAAEHRDRFKTYFEEWAGKIEYELYRIRLEDAHEDALTED